MPIKPRPLKPLIYLAGPITNPDPHTNVLLGMQYWREVFNAGFIAPFLPHLSVYQNDYLPMPYEDWLSFDFDILHRCDGLLRLPGKSPGADREVEFCKEHRIPVFFYSEVDPNPLCEIGCWAKEWTKINGHKKPVGYCQQL